MLSTLPDLGKAFDKFKNNKTLQKMNKTTQSVKLPAMNTTESKEYIEPTGFAGTTGEFVLQEPTFYVNRRRLKIGGIGENYTTILAIEDYTDNKEEAKANAILLSQSKEMAKALHELIYQFEAASILLCKHHNLKYDIDNYPTLKYSIEVLNKALNTNQ